MKVGVYVHRTRQNSISEHMKALAAGIGKHGLSVEVFYDRPPLDADALVVWGERKRLRCKGYGFSGPVLVAERGYVGDRMNIWSSLGWDGLNGRARFNGVWDDGRFERYFADLLKPWKYGTGYALLAGQVAGDMSLANVDIYGWYEETATDLIEAGWDVVFRQHPVEIDRGRPRPAVKGVRFSEASLEEDMAGAALVVAYNSNTLVNAVLSGVPVYAADEGSMVYGLSARDFNPVRPPREQRLNEIANVQWTMAEFEDGLPWEIAKTAM